MYLHIMKQLYFLHCYFVLNKFIEKKRILCATSSYRECCNQVSTLDGDHCANIKIQAYVTNLSGYGALEHSVAFKQFIIIILSSLLMSPLLGHRPSGLHIRRTDHNPPRGPSAGWWVSNYCKCSRDQRLNAPSEARRSSR
jgi:hypothetical protein